MPKISFMIFCHMGPRPSLAGHRTAWLLLRWRDANAVRWHHAIELGLPDAMITDHLFQASTAHAPDLLDVRSQQSREVPVRAQLAKRPMIEEKTGKLFHERRKYICAICAQKAYFHHQSESDLMFRGHHPAFFVQLPAQLHIQRHQIKVAKNIDNPNALRFGPGLVPYSN